VGLSGENMAARGEFYKMQFLKRWNTSQFFSLHLKNVGMVNYCTWKTCQFLFWQEKYYSVR